MDHNRSFKLFQHRLNWYRETWSYDIIGVIIRSLRAWFVIVYLFKAFHIAFHRAPEKAFICDDILVPFQQDGLFSAIFVTTLCTSGDASKVA